MIGQCNELHQRSCDNNGKIATETWPYRKVFLLHGKFKFDFKFHCCLSEYMSVTIIVSNKVKLGEFYVAKCVWHRKHLSVVYGHYVFFWIQPLAHSNIITTLRNMSLPKSKWNYEIWIEYHKRNPIPNLVCRLFLNDLLMISMIKNSSAWKYVILPIQFNEYVLHNIFSIDLSICIAVICRIEATQHHKEHTWCSCLGTPKLKTSKNLLIRGLRY